MKSIFKIGGGRPKRAVGLLLGVAALGLMACDRAAAVRSATAPDGGDAQRLVALFDYVGGDYRLAVRDGQVLSAPEYEEQIGFTADARRIAASLVGGGAGPDDPLLLAAATVEDRVKAKADPDAVEKACRIARDEVMARFQLQTVPTERPSLARAEELYAQACAVCHGAKGDGQGERAPDLDPPPASFRDPERLRDLSPYRVYNALTFGVAGTAMASFEALSPAERWNLAFYVFRLGHEGAAERGPVAMTLGDLSSRSDREIVEALQAERFPEPTAGLAYARREAAFREPPAGIGLERTRRLLAASLRAYRGGRKQEADRTALDAYLLGFEPLEPRLRARDPQGTAAIESKFHDLRSALSRDESATVERSSDELDRALQRLGGDRRALVPSLAAFLIYFREGIEAALLVAALLAGLRRLGRPEARRYVHAGWLLALPAGLVTWWFTERVIAINASQRELVEAIVALLAAAVLFSVSFWMISQAESRHWMGYLRRQMEQTLTRRNLLFMAGVSFLAVYREAAETVLFTQALLLEAGSQRLQVGLGALGGLVAVMGVATLMSRTVVKLPLRPFFTFSGALLCGLAITFAGSGIYELVAAGYLSPRPVPFPEVPWMGIHPDLTGLFVQVTIAGVIALAALSTLRKRPAQASERSSSFPRPQ